MGWAQWTVLVIAIQRILEVALSERNVRRLKREGGTTHGGPEFLLLAVAQTALLFWVWRFNSGSELPIWPLYALVPLCMAGRIWCVTTLGRFWAARIVTLETAPLVKSGPYRWLNHPIYLFLIVETVALPLAFQQWGVAAISGLVHCGIILWRIRLEERAIAVRRSAF